MYMDLLAKDTICQGVQIKVKEIPLKVYCNQCHKEALIDRKHIECPFCHSIDLKRPFRKWNVLIESIEVE